MCYYLIHVLSNNPPPPPAHVKKGKKHQKVSQAKNMHWAYCAYFTVLVQVNADSWDVLIGYLQIWKCQSYLSVLIQQSVWMFSSSKDNSIWKTTSVFKLPICKDGALFTEQFVVKNENTWELTNLLLATHFRRFTIRGRISERLKLGQQLNGSTLKNKHTNRQDRFISTPATGGENTDRKIRKNYKLVGI